MHSNEGLGSDGTNLTFYQSTWNIIGTYVVEACLDILNNPWLWGGLIETSIVLVLKKNKPKKKGSNLRPKTLFKVLHRASSKVIANRLKIILPSIISENQSAFVKSRLLTYNVMVAFEINHYLKRKTQGKKRVYNNENRHKQSIHQIWVAILGKHNAMFGL